MALAAFVVATFALLTDWMDGFLARKLNQITDFGKIADALVDKILVLGLFGILWFEGWLHPMGEVRDLIALILLMLVLARDVIVTQVRLQAARRGVVLAAGSSGKRKTVYQAGSIILLFLARAADLEGWTQIGPGTWGGGVFLVGLGLFYLSSLMSIISGTRYLIAYRKRLTKADAESEETGKTGESQ